MTSNNLKFRYQTSGILL